MRIGRVVVAGVALAAVAGTAWWLVRPRVGPPPTLTSVENVDPLVHDLVTRMSNEAAAAPRDAAARLRLGMACHANHLFGLAAIAYEQSIALDDQSAIPWYHLARVHVIKGSFEQAVEAFDRSSEIDATYAPSHWRRGYSLLSLGRLEDAEAAFRRAADLDPSSVAARVGLARVALQRRDADLAVELLEPLVRADPQQHHLNHLLGTAYGQLGRSDEARRHLARSDGRRMFWGDDWSNDVAAYNTGFESIVTRSQNLMLAGNTGAALDLLQRLRETQPNDPTVLNSIGSVYMMQQRPAEAVRILEVCLRSHPDHYATHLNLAVAYGHQVDLDRSLRHAERAVELNPALGPAHAQRGRVLLALRRDAEAAEALRAARRCGHRETDIDALLASTLVRLEQWPEGVELLEQIVDERPDDAAARLGLARVYAETGRLEEAWDQLRRARRLSPPDDLLRETIARLRTLEPATPPASPGP